MQKLLRALPLLVLVLILVLILFLLPPLAFAAPVRMPARIADGLIVVPVQVSGAGTLPFVLDTGATGTLVDEGLAAQLGLSFSSPALQVTAAGSRLVRTLALPRLEVGGVAAEGLEVVALPLDELRRIDPTIRGVLGQDVLRRTNWLIDYGRREVVSDEGGRLAPSGGESLPVVWADGRPMIAARVQETPVRLVLDSAATNLFLFHPIANLVPASRGRVTTHLGDAAASSVTVDDLRIGGWRSRGTLAAVVPQQGYLRVEDGLLPTQMFGRLYFDNRLNRVVLTP